MKAICQRCTKEFRTFPSNVARGQAKFCSFKCASPAYTVNCHVCSKTFRVSPSLLYKKYCSKVCRYQGRQVRRGASHFFYGKHEENPMFGRKHSNETKAKIAITSKGRWLGRKHKEESKNKASLTYKKLVALGIHPSWKGGKTSEIKMIRTSKPYRDWRTKVFERDDYTCQECGKRNGNGKRIVLNADHIKPFALYVDLRFELSNGRTLCLDCHKKTPTFARNVLVSNFNQI